MKSTRRAKTIAVAVASLVAVCAFWISSASSESEWIFMGVVPSSFAYGVSVPHRPNRLKTRAAATRRGCLRKRQ